MKDMRFPKIMQGVVVSDSMDKTVVVKVIHLKKHPLYKKYFKSSKRYFAHDPLNKFHTGDEVRIVESRPMSKNKHWTIVEKG